MNNKEIHVYNNRDCMQKETKLQLYRHILI